MADVTIVKERLLGLRFGGLSGFLNDASVLFSGFAVSGFCKRESVGTDVAAPRGTNVDAVVFTARFFRFLRGRLRDPVALELSGGVADVSGPSGGGLECWYE